MRSSAEWMSRAASSDPSPSAEEAVRDGPKASRIQCESVKPAQTSGASRAPGSSSSTQSSSPVQSGGVHRRARAAVAFVPLELVVARADRGTHERVDILGSHPRREPAVDRDDAGGRDHVALPRGLDHRRRQRKREQRLDELGGERMQRPRPLECDFEGGTSPSTISRNRCTSGMSACGGSIASERLDDRRRLDQRVVRDRRHRRVAAAPVHVDAERALIFSPTAQR